MAAKACREPIVRHFVLPVDSDGVILLAETRRGRSTLRLPDSSTRAQA